MEDQEKNNQVLESLLYLLLSGKVSNDKLIPALKKFTNESLDLDEVLSILKATSGDAFQDICRQIEGSQLEDAKKFYELNQISAIDEKYFSEQLKGLPLDMPKNNQEQGIYSELEDACLLLNDYFSLLKKQRSIPILFTYIEQKSLKKVDFFTENKHFLACLDIERLVGYAWHQASDDLRLELRQLKQQSQESYLRNFEEGLEAIKSKESSFVLSSPKAFLDALIVYLGEGGELSQELLEIIFKWPSSDIVSLLKVLWQKTEDKSKLSLLLTMRFGDLNSYNRTEWPVLLDKFEGEYLSFVDRINHLSKKFPIRLLYMWCMDHGEVSEKLLDLLKESCLEEADQYDCKNIIQRYQTELQIPRAEYNLLLGIKEDPLISVEYAEEQGPELGNDDDKLVSAKPKIILKDYLAKRDKEAALTESLKHEPKKSDSLKPEPRKPAVKAVKTEKLSKRSVWQEHMKPFISENWFMMAGLLLFVAGSLILSYFTWDKHWLFRYSLMPGLLASFTMGLAYLGKWIESKSRDFVNSASILRGAAIQLLPINFMTVALMSSDDMVRYKHFLIPVMAAIYLSLTWYGLSRWCMSVSKHLSPVLPRTLLAINSLVILAPLAETFGLKNNETLLLILAFGFYFGFAFLTYSFYSFSLRIKQFKLQLERRIIWFFSLMIAASFIQVFLWVHSHIRYLPEIYTYAPLVLIAGALVLMLERCSGDLVGSLKSSQEDESFVGYVLIVVGLVMSFNHPIFRIICLFLSSYIWFLQSKHRQRHVHYYITVTLLSVGFFAISGLTGFKAQYMPALGLINVLVLSLLTLQFRQQKSYGFAKACSNTQVVVLLAVVILAMVKHAQIQHSLLLTSFYLLFPAIMFMFRAYRDEQLKWIHLSMFVFALSLPYMGCVDMEAGTLVGNTLVFGLACLSIVWLLAIRYIPFYLLKEARSTVLWFYGSLSVVVMFIRIFMERHVPVDPEWYKGFMDYSGPLLMTAVLVLASYLSRSLIPSFMAAIIAVILFPELKANFRATFDTLGFGSGLGSAFSSLIMIAVAFFLRQNQKFKNLGEGDKFMMSSYFPLRRYDHTLFTLPLIGSACFLLVKTATFNLIRQEVVGGGVSMKGAVALIICSLCACFLYLYFRKQKITWLFHLAWIYLAIGMCFTFDLLEGEFHWTEPCFWTLLSLQVAYFLNLKLRDSYEFIDDLFIQPLSTTLAGLSHVSSVLLIVTFVGSNTFGMTYPLFFFIVGQFLSYLKSREKVHFGINLYLLICACVSPWDSHSFEELLMPSLYFTLICLLAHVFVSRIEGLYNQYKALFKSFLIMATLFSLTFTLYSLPYLAQVLDLSAFFILMTSCILILVYLENQSKVFLLLSFISFYSYFHHDQLDLIFDPKHLSLFALLFSLVSYGLMNLEKEKSAWMNTGYSLRAFKSVSGAVLYVPLILICEFSAILHVLHWRNNSEYIVATYIGAITLSFIAWAWKRIEVGVFCVITLALANVHLIRCFGKNYLNEQGLSEIHLLCLALGLTLLMTSLVRKYNPNKAIKSLLAHSALVLSLLVLVFLIGNYMSHPNLNEVSSFRFFISGAMSFLAALYFRSASRKPQDGEEAYTEIFEGIYHFGLSMSFWCLTLMIPFMRSPQTAILAFGLPAIYFYYMTEWYYAQGKNHKVYRNSSALLLLVLFLLYIFKGVVHMTFYPDIVMDNSYYHSNAPILIIYGLLLFRLHALGARIQMPLYGGFALVLGFFFTLSSAPSFSPFNHPIRASYLAMINAHIWILLNYQKSPLRVYFMQWSKLDEEQWLSLRKTWAIYLFVLTQIMACIALLNTWGQSHLFAPVLLLAASVVAHLAYVRKSKFFAIVTLLEILIAMHSGFLMDSYLRADDVIYVLLAIWAIFTFVSFYKYNNVPSKRAWPVAILFIALLIPHIIYHDLYSFKSLAAVVLMVLLSLLTAYSRENIKHSLEKIIPLTYLCVPVYLAYLAAYDEELHSPLYLQKEALPATLFALFLTASSIRYLGGQSSGLIKELLSLRYKVLNLVYLFYKHESTKISSCILWLLSGLTTVLLVIFMGEAFTQKQFLMLLITYAGLIVIWYFNGRKKRSQLAYYMVAYSLLIFMAFLRHQMLTATDLWRNEYDVWSSLLVSLTIAGLKPFIDETEKEMKNPLLGVLFLMPIIALGKSFYYGLGTDYILMILGVNSLIFSFLGKDDRESPYHLIAMIGYVSFTSMTLWNKLELRTLHTYVIPSGVGVLMILQLMKNSLSSQKRNVIRLVTLLMMVSTSAFYAVIAEPRSIAYNLTLITLCLLAMAFGSLWKIRLYLILGFTGLLIDILSIFTRVLIDLQRGTRMAILGSCILLIGGSLVFANLYYKTQQERIKKIISKWRLKLSTWE
ncbi:hypothetical protein PQO01_15015 [Lentisphaera marina]|uniref:hypothetical protein n=1 Tax=Lentisphaera marina TaxID=1111041 RepID=UPI0023650DA8|nr:hypothetical protein [Lentisphaera marina]MDD7986259.1 hypothetical protein [Lentisphaera marina]